MNSSAQSFRKFLWVQKLAQKEGIDSCARQARRMTLASVVAGYPYLATMRGSACSPYVVRGEGIPN